jgi:hypothetical protein
MRKPRFLLSLVLLPGAVAFGQAVPNQPAPALHPQPPITRLSYRSNAGVSFGSPGFRQVCIAVRPNGSYLLWRFTNAGKTESLAGSLLPEQSKDLQLLLDDTAFRKLRSSGPVLLHSESETLVVETPEGMKTSRRSWLSARGEASFPGPVTKLSEWLQGFVPEQAKSVE